MLKSLRYVFKENIENIYRIYSIAKYEILGDIRDSRLGLFWNFANPIIQVLTYWFVFGFIMARGDVDGIPYIYWMLGGMVVWFFVSPCITNGCKAIHSKVGVITKMKFPVSILPATVVLKELFNHMIIMLILVVTFAIGGYFPTVHWFGLVYYLVCAFAFSVAISMTTSVLNMLARDVRKLILAIMRLLLYLTPILWTIPKDIPWILGYIFKANPIYYIVQGYRDCFFYHRGFLYYWQEMLIFWVITLGLISVGSFMMYKFKFKFIDMM